MDNQKETALKLLEEIRKENEGQFEVETFEESDKQGVILKADYAEAAVTVYFLDFTVMELRVMAGGEEPVFYLHFELNNEEHARELYREMKESLIAQKDARTKHALLCCSCGLTTSFFAMKLNEAAKSMELDLDFEAVSYEKLYEAAKDKDIILLAPQIAFQQKNAESILKDKIVMTVPTPIFSGYKVFDMITLVNEKLSGQQKTEGTETASPVNALNQATGSVLVVSVINMEGRNQIAYRIYDNGVKTMESQSVKPSYRFSDIKDMIRVVTEMKPEIETICLVTPGYVNHGKLTYESAGIYDLDVIKEITDAFGRKVYLFNDSDMIALGYYLEKGEGEDIAFYFVPTGSYSGNIGIVANGSLIRSAKHMGGRQLEPVSNITTFPRNPYVLMNTPEGSVELAARFITGLISYTGIEYIAFYCKMIPDLEPLNHLVDVLIPDGYEPRLYKVDSIREYLYLGTLEALKKE